MFYRSVGFLSSAEVKPRSFNNFRAKTGSDCSIAGWKVPRSLAGRWALFGTRERKRIAAPRLPRSRFICRAVDYSCSCGDERSKGKIWYSLVSGPLLHAGTNFLATGEILPDPLPWKLLANGSVYRVTTSTFSYRYKTGRGRRVVKDRVSCSPRCEK